MIRYILAAPALLTLVFLSACETVEGAGQDIQSTGYAISDAARDADNE